MTIHSHATRIVQEQQVSPVIDTLALACTTFLKAAIQLLQNRTHQSPIMGEHQGSSNSSFPPNSSNTAPSGSGSSAAQSASSGDITQDDRLTIGLEYGSPMICAICESAAQHTLQQPATYFVVYDANSKAWSNPPGGDDSLVHSSKGHAYRQHLSQMQQMQNDWASNPCTKRNDGTYLYCFANYNAHREFAEGCDELPVQG